MGGKERAQGLVVPAQQRLPGLVAEGFDQVRGLLYISEHEGLHHPAGLSSTGLQEFMNHGHRLLPAELGTHTKGLIEALYAECLLDLAREVGFNPLQDCVEAQANAPAQALCRTQGDRGLVSAAFRKRKPSHRGKQHAEATSVDLVHANAESFFE
jgi:hypothetical protein